MKLLGIDSDGLPVDDLALPIEDPEGHLHPPHQHLLIDFLMQKAIVDRGGKHGLQVLTTTHSPSLASSLKLENLVLACIGAGSTKLAHRTAGSYLGMSNAPR